VLGTLRRQGEEAWQKGLAEHKSEKDAHDESFSGYTSGGTRPPDQRVVTIHQGREKHDTLIHELVHLNAGGVDFERAIGDALNEGVTEYLAQVAMRKAGLTPTGHYVNVVPTIEKIANRVTIDVLANAYFKDDVAILDRALDRQGIDLVEICRAIGHTYTRVHDIPMATLDLGSLLGSLGPITVEKESVTKV
jgi:hypothetical protein